MSSYGQDAKIAGVLTAGSAYHLRMYGTPAIHDPNGNIIGNPTTAGYYAVGGWPFNSNTMGFVPNANNGYKYKVPVSGIYFVSFTYSIPGAPSGEAFISRNVLDLNQPEYLLAANVDVRQATLSTVVNLTTNDTIQFGYYLSAGTFALGSRTSAQIYCIQKTS